MRGRWLTLESKTSAAREELRVSASEYRFQNALESDNKLAWPHTVMRQLLLILITLSLSWVTTDCSCQMSGDVPQLGCCCKTDGSHPCPQPRNCIVGAGLRGSGNNYCSVVTNAGTFTASQAESLAPPDRTLLGTVIVQATSRPSPIRLPISTPLLGHAGNTVPIYLLIGRLLR